jgi:hypothetical protein
MRLTRATIPFYSGKGPAGIRIRFGEGFVATKKKKQPEVVGFVGVGLDSADGHKRLTRAKSFVLVGGSQETHNKMQDVAIRFNEALEHRGKQLEDTSVQEVTELIREAMKE